MKENWTCRNIFISNWNKIFVMNLTDSNEVVNFFSDDETKQHYCDIGVWKIKTKKQSMNKEEIFERVANYNVGCGKISYFKKDQICVRHFKLALDYKIITQEEYNFYYNL